MPGCCRALVVTRMFVSALLWVQPVCTTFKDSGRVRKEGKLSQTECLLVRNSLKGSHGRSRFNCFRELTWDGGPSRQPMIQNATEHKTTPQPPLHSQLSSPSQSTLRSNTATAISTPPLPQRTHGTGEVNRGLPTNLQRQELLCPKRNLIHQYIHHYLQFSITSNM